MFCLCYILNKNLYKKVFLILLVMLNLIFFTSAQSFAQSENMENFKKAENTENKLLNNSEQKNENQVCSQMKINFSSVDVRMGNAQTVYDFTKSAEQISQIGIDAMGMGITHGLTNAVIKRSFEIKFAQQQIKSSAYPSVQGVCIYPAQIDLHIGYSQMNVYVDSVYPSGSCQQRTILKHENTHVMYDEKTLYKYQPVYKQTILDALKNYHFPMFLTEQQANERMHDITVELSHSIDQTNALMNDERDNLNNELDSPANYFETAQQCGSW